MHSIGIFLLLSFVLQSCNPKFGDQSDDYITLPFVTQLQGVWMGEIDEKCTRSFAVKDDVYTLGKECTDGPNRILYDIEVGRIQAESSKLTFSVTNHSCPDFIPDATFGYTVLNGNYLSLFPPGRQLTFVKKQDISSLPPESISVTYGCFDKSGQFVANPSFKL